LVDGDLKTCAQYKPYRHPKTDGRVSPSLNVPPRAGRPSRCERLFGGTIDLGLIMLVLFTPLAFGSVHIWAYTTMELTVFFLLAIRAVKSILYPAPVVDGALVPVHLGLLMFGLVVLLQTVPLPPDVLKAISPKAYELYGLAIPGYGDPAGADSIRRALSIYPHRTKVDLVKFLSYAGVFILITVEIREERRIKRIMAALIIAGFLEALYGLYGYFTGDPDILGFRRIYEMDSATGTYVNRNHFAGYLGVVVFAGIGCLMGRVPWKAGDGYGLKHRAIDFLNTARASISGLLLVMIITMVLGISFSLSRMGVFSFIASSLLIASIAISGRNVRPASVLFVILSLGLTATLWYGLKPLEERYHGSLESFVGGRAVVWSATGKLIKDYPLAGTGLGTYETVFRRYKPQDFKDRLKSFEHAHNDYLETLSEVGMAGIAPVLFVGIYFPVLLLGKRRRSRSAFAKGVSLGGIGAMAYMCLHSITDFNMHIPANALAFSMVAALAYSAANAGSEKRKVDHEPR
jgi:O-antigen ligase